jgi:hypothetical protein
MLYHLGKLLQIVGLLVVGAALVVGFQTTDPFTELKMLGAGALVFYAGWLVERKSGKNA